MRQNSVLQLSGITGILIRNGIPDCFRFLFNQDTTIVELTDITTGIVLDCSLKEAYIGTTLMNNHMSGDFPVLKPGLNGISWSGNVTSVVISPRWRYL